MLFRILSSYRNTALPSINGILLFSQKVQYTLSISESCFPHFMQNGSFTRTKTSLHSSHISFPFLATMSWHTGHRLGKIKSVKLSISLITCFQLFYRKAMYIFSVHLHYQSFHTPFPYFRVLLRHFWLL